MSIRSLLVVIVLIAVISGTAILVFMQSLPRNTGSTSARELLVYVAPVLSRVLDDYSRVFEEKHSVKVDIVVDATGRLVNRLELTKSGDVLVTADSYFMDQAAKKGLVDSKSIRVVSLIIPALFTLKRSNISINDPREIPLLIEKGYKLGIADPSVAPFGRLAVGILKKLGVSDSEIQEKILVFSDVNTLAKQLVVGSIDMAILPHVVMYWYPEDVEIHWLPPDILSGQVDCQLAAVTTYSRDKALAEMFVEELVDNVRSGRYLNVGVSVDLEFLSELSGQDYTSLEIPGVCKSW